MSEPQPIARSRTLGRAAALSRATVLIEVLSRPLHRRDHPAELVDARDQASACSSCGSTRRPSSARASTGRSSSCAHDTLRWSGSMIIFFCIMRADQVVAERGQPDRVAVRGVGYTGTSPAGQELLEQVRRARRASWPGTSGCSLVVLVGGPVQSASPRSGRSRGGCRRSPPRRCCRCRPPRRRVRCRTC